jgi:hypothetical protein
VRDSQLEAKSIENPQHHVGLCVAAAVVFAGRVAFAREEKDCFVDLGDDVRPVGIGRSVAELLGDRQQGKIS